LTSSNVSGTLQQKIYYYTTIGEISAILDLRASGWFGYTYDKIGRLTTETFMGTTIGTYAYNAIGNITSKTVGGNTFTYSYSASHKHAVSSITYNGTPYNYSYDNNGNMTSGPDFTNLASIQTRTSITYNADNMPTQIVHSSNGTTELTYGGTGERVKKRVYSGGTVTDTYYIGDHFEVKGGETIKYIFAGNLRVAQVKGTSRSFFHKDHLGSSTVMTDASGYELESTEYAPFGSQRAHTGTSTSDYRYTDQELDAENGLYNYNARLYDPFIGRFISPDTIVPEPFNPQSLNRYTYCLNNPLIYVDPSGHVSEEDLLKAGYTYDEETGDWLMPESVVTTPRLYMCGNGWGGIAYLTSEQIIGSWGAWYPIEPVPAFPEINNEYQRRLERYLNSSAPQVNPIDVVNNNFMGIRYPKGTKEVEAGIGWDDKGQIDFIDCSNLVHQTYKVMGLDYPYKTTKEFTSSTYFEPVTGETQRGDIMLWRNSTGGHMSFYDPNPLETGYYALGATSSGGVRYGDPSWFTKRYGEPKYYRYKK
jgi:RHS repeat-associated protein